MLYSAVSSICLSCGGEQGELLQARSETASALQAMYDEREAERAHLLAYAQEVSAKAGKMFLSITF